MTPTSPRPIIRLLELLERRWTLRLIWELRNGPLTYRDLQRACDDLSPTILAKRLRELSQALIIEKSDRGYDLTELGRSVGGHLLELGKLAKQLGPTL